MMTSVLKVKVSKGFVKGRQAKDSKGKPYYSFQGIRYAKPPVGDLRFKAPQPPEPWEGVWDASRERSKCYSRHEFFRTIGGSEDCLFINVYTPKLPTEADDNPELPVMVWVHGGGYYMSSGDTDLFGPEYLVAENVILVTFNYRLGFLGFLSVSNPKVKIPGNAGLKDMVMALEWVKENIAKFGGNPNSITLFGQSAGASGIHSIILSPKTEGLYHKVILQCGTTLHHWNLAPDKSPYFLSYLGLDKISDPDKLLEELRQLPLEKILEAQEKSIPKETVYTGETNPVGPVIEPESDEALITEPLETTLRRGNYSHVPMIIGFNSHEGISITTNGVPWLLNYRFTDNELLVARDMQLEPKSELSKKIGDSIKEFYYGDEKPGPNNIFRYIDYGSDVFAMMKVFTVSKLIATNSSQPVYLYRFLLDTELNVMKKVLNYPYTGAAHADEAGYLFTNRYVSRDLRPGSIEEISKNRMVLFWTNFAKTGDPNPIEKNSLINVVWKPIKKGDFTLLQIGKTLTSGKISYQLQKKVKFWTDLYTELKGEKCLEYQLKDW